MRNLCFKIPIVVLSLLILLGCSNRPTEIEGYEYFQFNAADKKQLLLEVPKKGDIISFKSQIGETISFKVKEAENGRQGAYTPGSFSGGGGYLLNYFDSQRIEMEFLDVPDPFATFELNISKVKDGSLAGSIYFELWNKANDGVSSLPQRILIDFDAVVSQMTINGKLYEKVLIFNSQQDEIVGSWFGIDRDVHIIYYDKKYGFIGFDDLGGNNWRLN